MMHDPPQNSNVTIEWKEKVPYLEQHPSASISGGMGNG